MVDMLYLSYRMTRQEYNITSKKFQAYLEKNFYRQQLRRDKRDKSSNITNALSEYGFQEIRLRSNRWDYCSIEIRLRPQLLINKNGYYRLTKISEFNRVSEVFNYVLKDVLSLDVPDFFNWKAKRVEAAIDLEIEKLLIPKYLCLFKKGYIPEYFKENKQTQEFWNSITNVYLMSDNKTVNWYNRYETLKIKESKSKKGFADYSETKGILRFETQVRDGNVLLSEMLSQQLLRKEVMKFYKLIVGRGDYHTLNKARKLLIQKVSNSNTRQEMIHMLSLIDHCEGINNAKELYIKGKNAKNAADKFGKTLRKLRDLNINPVVIPEEWGIESLENLYEKIELGFE